jgi:hypothetical protein
MNMIVEENDGERANERNERNKEMLMMHAVEFTT